MIGNSQSLLAPLLLSCVLSGLFLGLLYELLMSLACFFGICSYDETVGAESKGERYKKIREILRVIYLFFADVIILVTSAAVSVVLIYHSGGIFRGLVYIGMIVGYLAYRLILKKPVAKILAFVSRVLRRAVFLILFAVSRPFAIIFRGIVFLYHLTIGKIVGKIILKIKKCQEAKRLEAEENKKRLAQAQVNDALCDTQEDGYVYVGKTNRYKKQGRISFGKRS